jgi:hypothetical protein
MRHIFKKNQHWLTSEILRGCLGAGISFPEWIPRKSATALGTQETMLVFSLLPVKLKPTPVLRPLAYHSLVIDLHRRAYDERCWRDPFRSVVRRCCCVKK